MSNATEFSHCELYISQKSRIVHRYAFAEVSGIYSFTATILTHGGVNCGAGSLAEAHITRLETTIHSPLHFLEGRQHAGYLFTSLLMSRINVRIGRHVARLSAAGRLVTLSRHRLP
jgi:hypothetical protein